MRFARCLAPLLLIAHAAAQGASVAPAAPPGQAARFAAPEAAAAAAPVAGGGALQVLLSLALVVGAIVLLGWGMRRIRRLPQGRSGALRLIDEVALGPKERAVLLEVDGARLVVGVGDGRVALLHRSDVALTVATGVPAGSAAGGATAAGAVPPRFAEILRQALGR